MLFLCSWLARFFYLKPREEHVDNYSFYIFRCNSTLVNENTLYNVDCRYAEDLSNEISFTRTEDATTPCFKVLGEETDAYAGVSQRLILLQEACYKIKIRTQLNARSECSLLLHDKSLKK